MVLLGACVVFVMIGVALACLARWAVKTNRRLESSESNGAKLAAELHDLQNSSWSAGDRIGQIESIMRPDAGEIAPRVAVLERKQSVDTDTLVIQMKIFRRELDMFDERLIYMANAPAFAQHAPAPVAINAPQARDSATTIVFHSKTK